MAITRKIKGDYLVLMGNVDTFIKCSGMLQYYLELATESLDIKHVTYKACTIGKEWDSAHFQ